MDERRLRIGVVGAGHFGRFHALKVAAGARAQLTGVYDPDPARAAVVAAECGCPALSLDELIAASEAVIVAAPAEAHFDVALRAIEAGRHLLVEKPITATLAQADALAAAAASRGLVVQVGHLERFSAAHGAVSARVGKPLYIEAIRIAPFKLRGTDVSVILDLMIHDLDLVLALVDSPIESVDAVGVPLASEFEDIANARLRFVNGCVATITASRVSTKLERRMRIFGQSGYLTVDFANRKLVMLERAEDDTPLGFRQHEVTWQEHDAIAAEHAAFIASVLDGAPVLVDAAAGRRALAAALAVGEAMAASRARMLQSGILRLPVG
jgi:predicted dehydrogenase